MKTLRIFGLVIGFAFAVFPHTCSSQKFLRITSSSFGIVKIREIENHSMTRYRVKGSFFGRKAALVDLRDSSLFFDNGDEVRLAQLRGIGVRSDATLPLLMQKLFFYAGFGLIPLSVINNVITGQEVHVTPGLVYVSASAIAGGLITLWLRNKRIHTGKHKVVQIKERNNFGELNVPASR